MTQKRTETEAFVRHIVARIEAAERGGMASPTAIADHFNSVGLTTRKGRGWNPATVRKFLASPGAKKYRRPGSLNIRETTEADLPEILSLVRAAFDSDIEADLTRDLLADPGAAPYLSLRATENGKAVGHVLFTRARIENVGQTVSAALLCPLSVRPDAQRRGVGGALIANGLFALAASGTALTFVFGDPAYYGRHGFETASPHGLLPPYPIPREYDDAWMVQALRPEMASACAGTVAVSPALQNPAYWAV